MRWNLLTDFRLALLLCQQLPPRLEILPRQLYVPLFLVHHTAGFLDGVGKDDGLRSHMSESSSRFSHLAQSQMDGNTGVFSRHLDCVEGWDKA